MPVAKTLFTVLLSSPSDVESERKIVSNIIDEINEIHKNSRFGMILKTWDKDVSPSIIMETGQNLVDLEFNYEQADLLIGVFYKKLGTPVLDSESGTVHEIKNAISSYIKKASPDIKLYFKRVNVLLSDASQKEIEQYNKLINKKNEYMKIGIVQEFNNTREFENKCRKHLFKFFNDKIEHYRSSPFIDSSSNIITIKTRKKFERMEEILDRATNDIFIMGINLEGALNSIDLLKNKAKNGIEIKLLAVKPDDNLLYYFNMNDISVEDKKQKIISNLKILLEKLSIDNISIGIVDRIFTAGCVAIDIEKKSSNSRIIAQQYLNYIGTSLAPAMDIYSNNEELFNTYSNYLKSLWKNSDIYMEENE